MAVVVEELLVTLTARLDGYTVQLASAQRETDRRLDVIDRRFTQTAAKIDTSISRAALLARRSLLSIGAALSVRELSNYADGWTRVQRALQSTERVYNLTLDNAQSMVDLAIRTRSELEATTKLYTRTAIAAARLGYDTKVASDVTETFAKALKLGSAATSEQTSVMLQFSQALTKGKLDGDEFRSIMENAGVVQEALIQKLKVSGKTLLAMAADGKIGAKDLIEALLEVKDKVDLAFGGAPVTVAEAFQNLTTAMTEYIGKTAEAGGITQTLADSLQGVSNNIDNIAKGSVVLGALLLIAFGPAILAGIGAAAAGIGAATAAMGALGVATGAAALSFGGSVVAARLFGDQIDLDAEKGVKLADVMAALREQIREGLGSAAAYVAEQWAIAADAITSALRSSKDEAGLTAEEVAAIIKKVVNFTIGAFVSMTYQVATAWNVMSQQLPAEIIGALNKALAALETFGRNAAAILNGLGGNIDIEGINLGRIPNAFEGAADRTKQLWGEAVRAMSRDYVGEMGAAFDVVYKRAEELAQDRRWREGTTVTKAPGEGPKVYADNYKSGTTKKTGYERDVEQIRKRTAALISEAAAVGLSARETEKATAAAELLAQAKSADLKITPQLLATIDQLATAYANATSELAFLQRLQQDRENVSALRREIDLTGLYGIELHKARAEAELLAEAERQGVELTAERRAQISDVADMTAATETLREALADVKDTANSALSGFLHDLKDGATLSDALSGALDRIASKLLDMASSEAIDAALGGLLQGNGGAAGSASTLASLFGFAGGGVMTPNGPRQLQQFAGGGVSNKAAIFGEAGPEAAVPLPDGRRIPVELRLPDINRAAGSTSAGGGSQVAVTVAPQINLAPGVTAEDIARVKAELLNTMPGMVQQGVARAFDRSGRFARSGV